jgi:hypothetical protein
MKELSRQSSPRLATVEERVHSEDHPFVTFIMAYRTLGAHQKAGKDDNGKIQHMDVVPA